MHIESQVKHWVIWNPQDTKLIWKDVIYSLFKGKIYILADKLKALRV